MDAMTSVPVCLHQPYDLSSPTVHQSLGGDFVDEGVQAYDINSRCSLRTVHDVISRFDENKRELVKSIGFGGLLSIPLHTQINRKLALWLLTKVDESSQSLVIDSCRSFPFSNDDVGKVFGIPDSGKRVVQTDGARSDGRIDYVRVFLGLHGKDARSVKAAQDILDRTYSLPMQPNDEASFKVAFVVFVMALLLTPTGKHDYSNIEFWPALAKPNEIASFDWASYVIYRLLVAAAKVKSDIRNKVRCPLLSGCTFFLQVLYLDSVDLGNLNMPHSIFPRVQCFTADRLKAMADADASRMKFADRTEPGYGSSLPRPASDVCYNWARAVGASQRDSCRTTRLFDAAARLVSSMNIDEEAVTPVYLAMLQHRRDVIDILDDEEATLLEVISIICHSYKDGFKYSSSSRGMKRPLHDTDRVTVSRPASRLKQVTLSPVIQICNPDGIEGRDIPNSVRNRIRMSSLKPYSCDPGGPSNANAQRPNTALLPLGSQCSLAAHPIHDLQVDHSPSEPTLPLTQQCGSIFETPPHPLITRTPSYKSSPASANKVMSEFYLWSRMCKSLATVHSRASKDEFEETDEPIVKIIARHHPSPLTPWQLGQHDNHDVFKALQFYEWISKLQPRPEITAPWLLHLRPKFIELAIYDIHQVTARSDFDMDFMDICIRRIKQMDDILYTEHSEYRWRHIMESDFMETMLAGRCLTRSPSVRHQFTGTHISYDVPSCQCIFFPAIVNQRWVCYVWDLHANEVIVYDPSSIHDGGNHTAHSDVVQKLGAAMDQCSKFFPGNVHG